MFTGLVTDVGRVRRIERSDADAPQDLRFWLDSHYETETIGLGASIACAGVCLTVVDKDEKGFAVDVSGETLSKTCLDKWQEGSRVNLERSLRMGDELGGHLVSGHVDGLGKIVDLQSEGGSWRFTFEVSDDLAKFIAPKGSVTLNGVSLTVNDVSGSQFGINIIPHTFSVTTFDELKVGDLVNVEIDILARYVARQMEAAWATPKL